MYLGLDIGTSGTKALLCDDAGDVLATASAEHDVAAPKPGWSEQHPDQWWDACGRATKAVLRKARARKKDIRGVGLSGQMHGSVFLDERDRVLRPAILWNDQRTAEQCDAIEQAAGGRKALIRMVGNPALTGFTAPKILWLRDHEPKRFAKCVRVLLPKDHVRLRMTGEHFMDVSDASGTLLLDVAKRRWNTQLFDKLDLPHDLLPPLLESHEVAGHLTKDAAKHLGLAAGTPVAAGGGDQPVGAVGNGITTAGIVSATLGTSGVVFAHADEPAYDPLGRVHTMCAAVAGKWCVFGCMLAAGGSFQWFRNTLAHEETREARRLKIDPYELLVQEAAHAPAGCEGLFFMPYLTGERCPHPDPLARGGWVGLTARHDRAAMIRSVLEGITFGMKDQLDIMDEMGVKLRTVRLSGGGAKSPFWRQLQADVYGRTVATINSDEGPAYGAAILAGVGAGHWKNVPAACREVIHETQRLKPNGKLRKRYAQLHEQYARLYPTLKDEMHRLADLPG
mgnify:CR=1 FL=1